MAAGRPALAPPRQRHDVRATPSPPSGATPLRVKSIRIYWAWLQCPFLTRENGHFGNTQEDKGRGREGEKRGKIGPE
ncbi:hypothetical protein chiPu_0009693 [Chiloscyllium punctatum]|uniref:Uncharacterized protein n=1 Tax=Chiloscyllium punctatum TaxID=137246 RepID=A0A401SLH3_CHIPU|nr:hypothetical protein [Chiloscyllium punctatum]